MMAIFSSFHIPDKYRHRVLYFGILGAIVLRLLFISVGTALLSLGEWVLAVFGAIVLFTAVKMFVEEWKKHKADRLLRHSQAHSSQ
jgi:tellurite resistance protein TerC